jgi:hypothetical protein
MLSKHVCKATPTIVDGPNSPGGLPRVEIVSMMAIIISGADEPSAINVRLATDAFQTNTLSVNSVPSRDFLFTSRSRLVITSMDAMKMSEMIAIPKNAHTKHRP